MRANGKQQNWVLDTWTTEKARDAEKWLREFSRPIVTHRKTLPRELIVVSNWSTPLFNVTRHVIRRIVVTCGTFGISSLVFRNPNVAVCSRRSEN